MSQRSPYLTSAEAGREIDMTADGVRKLIRRGELRALRLSERRIRVPRPALDAYKRKLNDQPTAHFEVPVDDDPSRLAKQFATRTSRTPAAWLAAWKRGEIEDSAENMALLVQASAVRAAELAREERQPAREAVMALAAYISG